MASAVSMTFQDPHQYQARIRPAEVQMIPTARGDFQASLSQMNLSRLTVQHGWQSLPVATRTTLHPSRGTIMFAPGPAQPTIRIDGIDLGPEMLALGAPGEEHFLLSVSDCTWATVTLTPDTYAVARDVLVGDSFEPAFRTSMVASPPAALARLRALHHRVMTFVPVASEHTVHPEVVRAAEQALLTTIIDCLTGDGDGPNRSIGTRNSTAVMRRFHDLLDRSEGLPLYLMEVCASLGVSRRTLHNACVEHLGLSPHRFLWLRRMQFARQALRTADPQATTVTQIATDLGFWELGRFAGHYKWLFGEAPSSTLGARRR